jgi:hypothetical protein
VLGWVAGYLYLRSRREAKRTTRNRKEALRLINDLAVVTGLPYSELVNDPDLYQIVTAGYSELECLWYLSQSD